MRFGGPIIGGVSDPDQWIATLRRRGYSAAYCPVATGADSQLVRAYAAAAAAADIVIAEVGAFGHNMISPDDEVRRAAVAHCEEHLALADEIGARCCVNVAGSRQRLRGPHPENFSRGTFDLTVETVRHVIDAVKPRRAFYALETMPWIVPDSADSYVELIHAVDRPQFGVHLDPVNLVCSPRRFYGNADLIRECFAKLGPYVRSCHAKDTAMGNGLTTHLDEVRPGLGGLDYGVYLRELDRLEADTPLMMEHLKTDEEYALAAEFIRSAAVGAGVQIR